MVLCDKAFPGETQHTHLLSPDREPVTDQSPAWRTMSFTGVIYRNMGEGLFTGAEIPRKTTASPKPAPAQVTAQ